MGRKFWADRVRAPLLVAVVATLLVVLETPVSSHGAMVANSTAGRAAQLVMLWTAACAIAVCGWKQERLTADAARMSEAMADSLRGLDEIRYALDQAAIVAATDHRGVITYVNDRFCAISKYTRPELIGRDHRLVSSGYHSKAFIADLWQTIAKGDIWRGELRNRAKDGTLYWVDTTIVPFLDGQGRPRQFLAIHSDITKRKAAEALIREQAALTHLGQLAAVVAHEVRNPLAGLRASLQILDERVALAPRDRDVLTWMIQRIDGLNDKIGDLLLYARPRPPRLQPVDLGALAGEAAFGARAATGNTNPPIAVSGHCGAASADPDMLRATLLNLTINACQASPTGTVEIELSELGDRCRIAIRDHGPGIPGEVRDRMFEPFFTTRPNGTGLGLAIVKRLLDLQRGAVELADSEGGGSVAIVTVPAANRGAPGPATDRVRDRARRSAPSGPPAPPRLRPGEAARRAPGSGQGTAAGK